MWPLAVRAQQSAPPVIGYLHSGLEAQSVPLIGFRKGLNEAGFVEGRNIEIQKRFAEGHYDRLPALASDLVNQHIAVLAVAGGVQTALAAKSANITVPVVFAIGSDPVQFGLVESLNRPGGNMTGVSFFTTTLEDKATWLAFRTCTHCAYVRSSSQSKKRNCRKSIERYCTRSARAGSTHYYSQSYQRA